jgi:hypothetical protein
MRVAPSIPSALDWNDADLVSRTRIKRMRTSQDFCFTCAPSWLHAWCWSHAHRSRTLTDELCKASADTGLCVICRRLLSVSRASLWISAWWISCIVSGLDCSYRFSTSSQPLTHCTRTWFCCQKQIHPFPIRSPDNRSIDTSRQTFSCKASLSYC